MLWHANHITGARLQVLMVSIHEIDQLPILSATWPMQLKTKLQANRYKIQLETSLKHYFSNRQMTSHFLQEPGAIGFWSICWLAILSVVVVQTWTGNIRGGRLTYGWNGLCLWSRQFASESLYQREIFGSGRLNVEERIAGGFLP